MARELTRLEDIYFSANLGETISKVNTISDYPTEDKLTVSENIQNQPLSINFSGVIINDDGISASESLQRLRQYMDEGKILTYAGRNIVYDVVIESLETVHNAENSNGFDLTMTLKKIRVTTPEEFLVDFSKVPKPVINIKKSAAAAPAASTPIVTQETPQAGKETVEEVSEGTAEGKYEKEITKALNDLQQFYEQ